MTVQKYYTREKHVKMVQQYVIDNVARGSSGAICLCFTLSMQIPIFLFPLEKEAKWEGSFIFIQGADCQYGMIDDMAEKSPIGWQEEIRLTRIAVDRINQMKPKPKFFVVCGDLVHAFPGTCKPLIML